MPTFIERLKTKWKIQSNWDFWMIMLTFSLAGSSIGFVRRPIFHHLGITAETPFLIKAIIYIPLIVPIYQAGLLFFGTLLGQCAFFWEKEKKLFQFLSKGLQKPPKRPSV